MKLNNITHVFFDLDHTLWDFDKNSSLTFNKIFKLNNIDIELKDFLKIYEPINFNYWKLYRQERIDKESLRYNRLSDTFDALNFDIKSSMINKLSEQYICHLSTFNNLFDGATEILDYLFPKYQLHIITNGFKEVQQGKLNNAHIDHYFQTVTNSEMVGVKKPNPKIFNHALSQARATIEGSVMIGDNLEADIFGAMDVGLEVICFNYHNECLVEDIKFVDNLLELKRFL
jgi:putative hydrolase of the HAD superfamily